MRPVRMQRSSWVVLLVLFIMGTAPSTFAQFSSGIVGTVTDPSGGLLAGVQITLANTGTGVAQTAVSNEAGVFRFPSLPPGNFQISAAKDGFSSFVQENINLQAAQTLTAPIVLKIGTVQNTVTVTTAPAAIQLDEAKIGANISGEELRQLPLAGSDIFNLIGQTPGVTGIGTAQTTSSAGTSVGNDVFSLVASPSINANGQRGDANSFYLDNTLATSNPDPGVFNLTPNPESIEELHVSLNDYSAEYGRSGSIVIQAVSRSGTNHWHGSLFEYHQDSSLTARNEFQSAKVNGRYFPAGRRNEFGGSLGGPIQKDKTFFFFSYDQLKSSQATTLQGVAETPDFTAFMKNNYPNRLATQLLSKYPATAQIVVPGSLVSVQQLDPNCATTAPVAGIPCTLNVLETVTDSYAPSRNGLQWNLRGDRYFRDANDRVSINFYRKTNPTAGVNIRQAFATPTSYPSIYSNVDYTHVFSPILLNEAAIGYTRISGNGTCENCQVPPINLGNANFANFGNGFAPAVFLQNDFHWRDVLSINHGKHSVKVGVEAFRDQENDSFTGPQLRPTYTFAANTPTQLSPIFDFANDNPTTESNINFDLRTGTPSFQNIGLRTTTLGFFGQDTMKLSPHFTLNAGLRWDFSTNPVEAHGRLANVILGSGNNLMSQVSNASVAIVPKMFHQNQIANFAPRLGFEWDPLGTGKLSVRGAIGVFYNRWPNKVWSDPSRNNPPYEGNVTAATNVPGPLPNYGLCAEAVSPFNCAIPPNLPIGLNPRGGALNALSSIGGTTPNLKYSYNINRFFGVQYAFRRDWVLEADYNGAKGNSLYVNSNLNRCLGCFNPTTGGAITPNPYFSSINLSDNVGYSIYNGGTVAVTHRMSQSFVLQAAFTFGKTISVADVPGPGSASDVTSTVYDPYNIGAQRSLASFDIPRAFTANGLWVLPKLSDANLLTRGVLGGWQVSGTVSLQAGYPYTVQDGGHSPDGGTTFVLPNVAAREKGHSCDRSGFLKGCLDPTAFTLPCPLNAQGFLSCGNGPWEGNSGQNSFRGPGFADTDMSFSKYFPVPWFLKEGARLQIRGDFYNLFNRVNLLPPTGSNNNGGNGNLQFGSNLVNTNASFGKSTSSYTPRTIQVGARLQF